MPELFAVLKVLALLWVANAAPIVATLIFGKRYAFPVDFNLKLPDRQALFGTSKTWRGLTASLACTVPLAMVFGMSFIHAAIFTLASMAGDLFSSFTKRRLGIGPSKRALLLDQIPEALFPVGFLCLLGQLGWSIGVIIVICFTLTDIFFSRVLYRWHIRKKPY